MASRRFVAPRTVDDLPTVRRALQDIQSTLDGIAADKVVGRLELSNFSATAGSTHRVSPPSAGVRVALPRANEDLVGQTITLVVESPSGAVLIEPTEGAKVNDQSSLSLTAAGSVQLLCTGFGKWVTSGGGSGSGKIRRKLLYRGGF